MYSFGKTSLSRLSTCRLDLQRLFKVVVKKYDCTVVCGHRGKKDQNKLYPEFSKVMWPNSKHNSLPSKGVDVAPWNDGIIWDERQCYHFAGYVKRVAEELNIKIRNGGDWDSDNDVMDQDFLDPCHFEIVGE